VGLTTPSKVAITQPSLPASGQAMPVSRRVPLSIAWAGPSAGQIIVTLDSGDPLILPHVSAFCIYNPADQAGVIPQSVLSALTGGPGNLAIQSLSSQTMSVGGGWTVRFIASFTSADSYGVPYNVPVEFQ
jgi:hypothetical protein